MKNRIFFKYFSLSLLSSWLLFFALFPFALMFMISFLETGDQQLLQFVFSAHSYALLINSLYANVFFRSFYFAIFTAAICLCIGYPFAYIVAKLPESFRMVFIFLMIIPFWTSSLIRLYAMIIIIRTHGLLNHFLMWLHIIHQPLQILYTHTAVMIGLVYTLLPFMVLPIFANLEKFDWQLIDAAKDLGAKRWQTFAHVIIPNTIPGIIAGIILVLLPAMTLFYIPNILGGDRSLLLGDLIKNQFLESHNWPLGSAVSVLLTVFMGALLFIYWRFSSKEDRQNML